MGAGSLDSLYTRWAVLGSRCKLTIEHSTSTVGSHHCLIPHPNVANPFSAIDVIRAGTATGGKTKHISPRENAQDTCIQSYLSTARMYGISNSRVVDDPNFGGSSTTDPSFYPIWVIGAQSSDSATTTNGIYTVELTYYVKYWQRNIDPAT